MVVVTVTLFSFYFSGKNRKYTNTTQKLCGFSSALLQNHFVINKIVYYYIVVTWKQ